MKKITKNLISKSLLLFLFVIMQTKLWAEDIITSDSKSRASVVFSQPKFWIGVALLVGFIVAFIVVGKEKKQPELQ